MSTENFISTWSRKDPTSLSKYRANLKSIRLKTTEALAELDSLIGDTEASETYSDEEKKVITEKAKTYKVLLSKRLEVTEQRINDISTAVYEELEFRFGAGAIAAAGLSEPSTKIFGYYSGLCTKMENILARMYFGEFS